jgi:hypothetical protein
MRRCECVGPLQASSKRYSELTWFSWYSGYPVSFLSVHGSLQVPPASQALTAKSVPLGLLALPEKMVLRLQLCYMCRVVYDVAAGAAGKDGHDGKDGLPGTPGQPGPLGTLSFVPGSKHAAAESMIASVGQVYVVVTGVRCSDRCTFQCQQCVCQQCVAVTNVHWSGRRSL